MIYSTRFSRVFASFPTQTFSFTAGSHLLLPFSHLTSIHLISIHISFSPFSFFSSHRNPQQTHTNMPDSPAVSPLPKDPEGITEQLQSVSTPPPPPQVQKAPRQKKIAVLTSGGDSAGMNAAGE